MYKMCVSLWGEIEFDIGAKIIAYFIRFLVLTQATWFGLKCLVKYQIFLLP